MQSDEQQANRRSSLRTASHRLRYVKKREIGEKLRVRKRRDRGLRGQSLKVKKKRKERMRDIYTIGGPGIRLTMIRTFSRLLGQKVEGLRGAKSKRRARLGRSSWLDREHQTRDRIQIITGGPH